MTEARTRLQERWLGPGVAGIGMASLLSDTGHEIPTALLPNLLTATLGAPATALGLIEGIADGLAGAVRLASGALADDPHRRRSVAIVGYTTTAVLQPHRCCHHRLAGRHPACRRLGRPRPARPRPQCDDPW